MDNIPFGPIWETKDVLDFFMYYLACKSTVETLMSGCPFGIPKHKQKWSSWWLGESLRISLANADPHLCILCRLLLHRRQGRSYKRDRSCCTRGIHGWWTPARCMAKTAISQHCDKTPFPWWGLLQNASFSEKKQKLEAFCGGIKIS